MEYKNSHISNWLHVGLGTFVGIALGVVLFAAIVVSASENTCDRYENRVSRQAVDLVHDAVDLVKTVGKEAFEEFSVKGSRWFDGEMYVFVHSMDGELLANGAFSELIGSNMKEFKDLAGKPTVQLMIDEVTRYGKDNGWVHYLWPQPGAIEPSWKSTFVHSVRGPDGKMYIVGTGIYNAPIDRCFTQEQVDEAVMLIERSGQEAFAEIGSRTGPFLWKDSYIFVLNMDGVALVNGVSPELVGTNLMEFKDSHGKAMVKEMFLVADAGGGWVEYLWPKPGYSAESKKHAYVKLAQFDGKQYLVGCGVYLN